MNSETWQRNIHHVRKKEATEFIGITLTNLDTVS